MYCKSCGIKTNEEFCSQRCVDYGRADFVNHKKLTKYPYETKCKDCDTKILCTNYQKTKCSSCIKNTRSIAQIKRIRTKKVSKEYERTCDICGKEFTVRTKYPITIKKYCSKKCYGHKMSVIEGGYKHRKLISENESFGQIRW